MEWLLPLLAFASLSIRSPNVLPNPLDYQYSVGVEKTDQLYLNRTWERELGQYYIDEEYFVTATWRSLWLRDRYVNKTSKGICYNQSDVRYAKDGFSAGYALRYIDNVYEHKAVAGWQFDRRFNIILANGQLTVRTELIFDADVVDYSVYAKVKFGLLKNLDFYTMLQAEKVGNIMDFQVKAGVEIEIPTLK